MVVTAGSARIQAWPHSAMSERVSGNDIPSAPPNAVYDAIGALAER
ncbi:hypothetical protein J2Y55_001786 [Bosea sp. BE125]|nr:hypothetical protein [Bosea sp. BE125]